LVDLDEIKKRWGDPEKGSQYYADVHALMYEVERLQYAINQVIEYVPDGWREDKAKEIAEGNND